MKRTQIVFVVIVVAALAIVGVSLWLRQGTGTPALPTRETVEVRILTSLPVEPWVREAAAQFNEEKHRLEGKTVQVRVIPMDGLTAMGKWDRDEFGTLGDRSPEDLSEEERARLAEFPTVWLPESRYLPELVNATYKERLGRDVFLGDGEYRARPVVVSLFSWGIYSSRAQVLRARFGEITWQAIHDAATAKGGWPELGGKPEWGYFKLVVPNPRKNVAGLMAMVAAAGEYYGKTRIEVADVTNPEFQKWLGELMGAVTDFSSLGSYTVENLALFGYSMGDGGQLLESELLVNMAGILTRWEDPLEIVYPKYVTWFDFPYTIWIGPETTALEKNAALEFEKYLLSPEVQKRAVAQGLRPANTEVSISEPDSLFVRWKDQGAVTVIPRTTRMHPPDRDVLLALLRWFDLNVAER
ncbi:MAG: substrate-binding domain-containing protein [Anaerolineae bacterium]|nr:substrate-binding domain-containing protein [Anaerolineae bacterium]